VTFRVTNLDKALGALARDHVYRQGKWDGTHWRHGSTIKSNAVETEVGLGLPYVQVALIVTIVRIAGNSLRRKAHDFRPTRLDGPARE